MIEPVAPAACVKSLPALATCFALRDEYLPEMEGMLATLRQFHPDWGVVVGRGKMTAPSTASFEVESPTGAEQWTFPQPLTLDGSADDWRRITRMKAWWLQRVWRRFAVASGASGCKRLIWIDADSRLRGPLNFLVPPEADVIAAPWWGCSNANFQTLVSSVLLLQGSARGPTEQTLTAWTDLCLKQIDRLPPPNVEWLDGDQELLTEILNRPNSRLAKPDLIRLSHQDYCGEPSPDGRPQAQALVDQWYMSRKMKRPEDRGRAWPPPERFRSQSTPIRKDT